MTHIAEIRRLLIEATAALDPARLEEAPHPVVPVAIASTHIRDALHLLALEGGPVGREDVWWTPSDLRATET